MAHSVQMFDHLDNKVLLAWFQMEHPKFMVHVFDHSGKDIAEKTAITVERLKACISIITDFVHQGAHQSASPRLNPKISEEAKEPILDQHIWSSMDITFEVLPFNCPNPPELLFCLSSFTTLDANVIHKTIVDVWAYDDNRHHIDGIFSMCGFPDNELVYKATRDLIHSVRVETSDFKITGGISVPCFNIFATSPTNDAKMWTELQGFLHILEYPTNLDGYAWAPTIFLLILLVSALASHPYPNLALVILVILAFPFALYLSLQQSQYIWPDPFSDEAYPCSVPPSD
ncbi:uncharacterized protein EDB93DRAFT_1248232 [Suillus bovinus]|uniref:uncharacterized protein n=1 Tax=Suillus bovinus TaxID=48563 RepID=UPI001B8801F0|nr:uncharacterized protein EDB93DRAFT_1248232 [Suillus bovinus]KAG2154431.1 hypothetical protein EDB93DRAFT_1248232 [Suillus bovinus]